MSINGITPIGRVSAAAADTHSPEIPVRSVSALPPEDRNADMDSPARPLRFPWLSRLSMQLEAAANQRAAFAPAPVLGDNVDKSV